MRSGRGLRDEFRTFYAGAYPELVAQVLAITGDARIAKSATDTTLAKAWRSWPTLRETADPLVRARWMAVGAAAEHEAKACGPAETAVEIICEDGEAAVVVTALQVLPPVQRRALVLHYMGGLTVRDMAALSGSSAEHVELLLDDGFATLAATIDWAHDNVPEEAPHEPLADRAEGTSLVRSELGPADRPDEVDRRFDWTAGALADTAARIPYAIAAPSPAAMLRRAALVRWSTRAVPVAAAAACVAVAVIIAAQPGATSGLGRPTIYTQNDQAAGTHAQSSEPDLLAPAGTAASPRVAPVLGLRSVALTSMLDPLLGQGAAEGSGGSGPSRPDVSVSSPSGLLLSSTSTSAATTGSAAAAGSSGSGTTGTATTPPSTITGPPTGNAPSGGGAAPVDTPTTTAPPVPADPTTDPAAADPTTVPVATDPATTTPATDEQPPTTDDTRPSETGTPDSGSVDTPDDPTSTAGSGSGDNNAGDSSTAHGPTGGSSTDNGNTDATGGS